MRSEESFMADLGAARNNETPVRAALRGRPGLASQEVFSKEELGMTWPAAS